MASGCHGSNSAGIGAVGDPAMCLDATGAMAIAFDTTQITSPECRSNPQPGGPCHTLSKGQHPPAIAFSSKDSGADAGDLAPTLRAMGHSKSHANAGGQLAIASPITSSMGKSIARAGKEVGVTNGIISSAAVRRLTPRECERLQGFPDDYTLIPYRGKHAADGPRYKALGNSMAVPVMRWIGERINMLNASADADRPEAVTP
jgi:DNA (cytosine-5)-methyltransferase 1